MPTIDAKFTLVIAGTLRKMGRGETEPDATQVTTYNHLDYAQVLMIEGEINAMFERLRAQGLKSLEEAKP